MKPNRLKKAVIAGLSLLWVIIVPSALAQSDKPATTAPAPASVKPPASAPPPAPTSAAQPDKPGAALPATPIKPPAGAVVPAPSSGVAAPVGAPVQGLSPQGASVAPPPPALRRSRANQDARHCLNLGTGTAMIRCAERYL